MWLIVNIRDLAEGQRFNLAWAELSINYFDADARDGHDYRHYWVEWASPASIGTATVKDD